MASNNMILVRGLKASNLKNQKVENLLILALRAVSENRGITGKTLGIQGVCDMVEEFLGVDREKFVKEIVKTNAILDAAITMWHQKERKARNMFYMEHIGSYDDLLHMESFYTDLYDLCDDGVNKIYKNLFQEYAFRRSIFDMTPEEHDDMVRADEAYDEYMKEQWEEYEEDYDY